MSAKTKLILRFRGWGVIRIPTEPDPPDEPWGASGYTFAYAGEPPLDGIVRTQPLDDPQMLRPGTPRDWSWGVNVYDAFILFSDGMTTRSLDLLGHRVKLHGEPRLENRSWLFTPPGWEPIEPFDLAIESAPGDAVLRRTAPLDPNHPARPVWRQPVERLLAHGARDLWPEWETVGSATGIWDPIPILQERLATLKQLRREELNPPGSEDQQLPPDEERANRVHCLESRIRQLEYALANPRDRRVMVRPFVERFGVTMAGDDAQVPASGPLADLATDRPWLVDFWIGAWDFDLLAAYFHGALQVPFRPVA